MKNRYLFILGGAALIGAVIWFIWPPKQSVAPTTNTANSAVVNTNTTTTTVNTSTAVPAGMIVFSTTDLPDRDPAFDFTVNIPKTWRVEYVSSSTAINLYDPKAAGATNLEKSQIFIKYFTASTFLTLTTVDIKSQTASTINGRSAMTYVIEKKPGIKDFVGQPSWRNAEHTVTDIRSTSDDPTTFYVFAKSPEVSDDLFESFLNSIKFIES